MGARIGIGVSTTPGAASAAGESVGAALREVGGTADTVLLFATTAHADPRPLVAAAQAAARGAHVVGCGASGVIGGAREIEDGTAVVAMALHGDLAVERFHNTPPATPDARSGLALIFADGYSAHPEAALADLARALPNTAVAGAIAVGPAGAFPAYRWLDGEISAQGVTGVIVRGSAAPIVEVTQGAHAVGAPLTVTEASGKVVAGLDGRSAFEVFAERARPLLGGEDGEHGLRRAAQTLFLAVPRAGDHGHAIRGILQFDPDRGLLALSEPVEEGTRVAFAVRDAQAARDDLRRTLARVKERLEGRPPRFGVYFACAGRGRALFGVDDHDVSFIQGSLGAFPLIGMFGGGELEATRMHLFAGVLAVVP
jgi:small ligand-binding sensory domain FIST